MPIPAESLKTLVSYGSLQSIVYLTRLYGGKTQCVYFDLTVGSGADKGKLNN